MYRMRSVHVSRSTARVSSIESNYFATLKAIVSMNYSRILMPHMHRKYTFSGTV